MAPVSQYTERFIYWTRSINCIIETFQYKFVHWSNSLIIIVLTTYLKHMLSGFLTNVLFFHSRFIYMYDEVPVGGVGIFMCSKA